MKKLLLFLCAVLALVVTPVVLFAQVDTTATGSVSDLLSLVGNTDLKTFFASIGALAPLVYAITAIINKALKADSDILKQLISWIIGIGLCFLGWFLKIGMFAGIEWWLVVIYGLVAGLSTNGAYKAVKSFLKLFGINV